MLRGLEFRIYPNMEQRILIARTLGCCRLVYNRGLELRQQLYGSGKKANYEATSAALTDLKHQEQFLFLKEVDSVALQQALRDLDRAYTNFFEKRAGYPNFKCRHDSSQSYRTLNDKHGKIRIEGRHIRLPKLGLVKIRQTRPVGKIRNVTVKKTSTGKYFAVLLVEEEPELRPNAGGIRGIDVGIKKYYTDDRGNTVENPKHLEKAQKKLRRENRRFAKTKKGSKNHEKQRMRLARAYEKVTNQRNDFLQKESTKLVRDNQVICIEDLNIKGMVRNHKLAKAIQSASWGTFFNMLEYKAVWYGCEVIRIPMMYPSSQKCSVCGYKNTDVKDLKIRVWKCPVCHTVHDRDGNAAINILNRGLAERLRTA